MLFGIPILYIPMLLNKIKFIYPNWETKTNIIANFAGYPAAAAGGAAHIKRGNIQMNLQHTVCNGIIYIQRALGALLPSACNALYVVCKMQKSCLKTCTSPGAGPPTHSLIIFPVPSAVEAARLCAGRPACDRARKREISTAPCRFSLRMFHVKPNHNPIFYLHKRGKEQILCFLFIFMRKRGIMSKRTFA